MPTWDEILKEINSTAKIENNMISIDYDGIRKKYIKEFADYRNRNVIVYYSDWLSRRKNNNLDVCEADMIGFVNATQNLDDSKGLDLIIHTPGGSPDAAEGIVKFLHSKFGDDIEVFIPHLAMSAGTMIACASRKIWMGIQSSLGPVDPQFNLGAGNVAGYNIKREFEKARADLVDDSKSIGYWNIILNKYPQCMYYIATDAIKRSETLVKEWLSKYMFKDDEECENKVENIINQINVNTGSHGKHFSQEDCIKMGLKIEKLENDSKLLDKLLSIYHCLQIVGDGTNINKIIENNLGKSIISHDVQK